MTMTFEEYLRIKTAAKLAEQQFLAEVAAEAIPAMEAEWLASVGRVDAFGGYMRVERVVRVQQSIRPSSRCPDGVVAYDEIWLSRAAWLPADNAEVVYCLESKSDGEDRYALLDVNPITRIVGSPVPYGWNLLPPDSKRGVVWLQEPGKKLPRSGRVCPFATTIENGPDESPLHTPPLPDLISRPYWNAAMQGESKVYERRLVEAAVRWLTAQ